MAKMFVNYSKTKSEFMAAGLETKYTNHIVFIGNGECVYTHGKYFGNVEEALATLRYFSTIKVGDITATAAGKDGVITFASTEDQKISIDVDAKGLTFGLSDSFIAEVDAKALKSDVEASIAALTQIDEGYATRIQALETAIGMGGGEDGGEDQTVTAQIASLANRIGNEETARAEADEALSAAIAKKVEITDYNQMVENLNNAIDAKVAQSDYDTKVAALEQADEDNLAAAKKHADDLNTAMDTRMDAVEGGITTLNGDINTEGSVMKAVADAIDDFATKISDNGSVDTFQELVNYVAAHGTQVTGMLSDISKNKTDISNNTTAIGENASAIAKEVTDREEAIETLSGTVTANAAAASTGIQEAKDAAAAADGKAVAAQDKADDNAELLAKLDGANDVEGSIKKQIKDAVEAEAALRVAGDNSLQTAVDGKVSQSAYDEKVSALETAIGEKVAQSAYDEKVAALESAINSKVAQETYNAKVTELGNSISANSTAISEEVTRAKAAEQANATAIANEAARADGAEKAIRGDLGTKEDAKELTTAFGRIAALEENINDLTGGNGTIAEQLEAFKTAEVTPVATLANNNKTQIEAWAKDSSTEGSIDYKDAQTLASAKSYAEEKANAAQSAAEAAAASELASQVAVLNAKDTSIEGKVDANTAAIAKLNGNSSEEGSVDKKIADAINAFATSVTGDNDTIDTFAEIVEYISNHGGEFGAVVTRLGNVETKASANETAVGVLNGDASVEGSVAHSVAAEATLRTNADNDLSARINAVKTTADAAATAANLEAEVTRAKAAEAAAQTAADNAQAAADANLLSIQAMNLSEVSGFVTSIQQSNGVVTATASSTVPADKVAVTDSGNKLEASNVEAALAELADMWLWEEL